jgi:hypothetical protein
VEDRLERVLNRVVDWLKYEEAKNGALIALNGVVAGAILTGSTPSSKLVSFCQACSLTLLLISLLFALCSFYPLEKSDQPRKLAPVLRDLWWNWLKQRLGYSGRETKKPSLLFFEDIAGRNADVYLEELRASVQAKPGTPLESDYAREVVAVSNIALLKLKLFEAAFCFGFLAFIFVLVAAFARVVGR